MKALYFAETDRATFWIGITFNNNGLHDVSKPPPHSERPKFTLLDTAEKVDRRFGCFLLSYGRFGVRKMMTGGCSKARAFICKAEGMKKRSLVVALA